MGRFVGPKATSEKDRARPPRPPPPTSPSTAPFKRRDRKDGGIATSRDGDARPRRRRVRRRGHLDVLLVGIFLGNTQKLGARDCSRRHRRAGVRGRRRDRHLGIGVGVFRGNAGRVAVEVGPVSLGQRAAPRAACPYRRSPRLGSARARRRGRGRHHHGRVSFLRGLLLVPHREASGGGAPRDDPADRPHVQLARARPGGGQIAAERRGHRGDPVEPDLVLEGPDIFKTVCFWENLPWVQTTAEPMFFNTWNWLRTTTRRSSGWTPAWGTTSSASVSIPTRPDVRVEPVRDDAGVLQR